MIGKKALCDTRGDQLKLQLRFQHSTRFPNLCVCNNSTTPNNSKKKWRYQPLPTNQGKVTQLADQAEQPQTQKKSFLTKQQTNLGTFCYRMRIHRENGQIYRVNPSVGIKHLKPPLNLWIPVHVCLMLPAHSCLEAIFFLRGWTSLPKTP